MNCRTFSQSPRVRGKSHHRHSVNWIFFFRLLNNTSFCLPDMHLSWFGGGDGWMWMGDGCESFSDRVTYAKSTFSVSYLPWLLFFVIVTCVCWALVWICADRANIRQQFVIKEPMVVSRGFATLWISLFFFLFFFFWYFLAKAWLFFRGLTFRSFVVLPVRLHHFRSRSLNGRLILWLLENLWFSDLCAEWIGDGFVFALMSSVVVEWAQSTS